MKKQEAIELVNKGIGSIYSKEDVLNLLNQIEESKTETPSFDGEAIVKGVSDAWVDKAGDIFSDLGYEIKDDSIINNDDCTFEINYGNTVELTDISFDSYSIDAMIDNCAEAVFEFIKKAIVDACEPKEEEQMPAGFQEDDDKTRIEEGLDHKG